MDREAVLKGARRRAELVRHLLELLDVDVHGLTRPPDFVLSARGLIGSARKDLRQLEMILMERQALEAGEPHPTRGRSFGGERKGKKR